MASMSPALPIDEIMGELKAALAKGSAVLVAPPGAGKTTRAPLELIDESWAAGSKIVMLEPRRLAARAAAARMAESLGEPVGRTIGLRVRMETRVCAQTRIEVVTEGVFSRMIVEDPQLSGIAAVLFDEFHERSLDGDVGLALALESRSALREDLRLLVMSATLDGARTAALMGEAPLVESRGRSFPVDTRYVGRNPAMRIEEEAARVIARALREEAGSILVFLPGRGEIDRTAALLREKVGEDVTIAPLHGGLDPRAQDLAVRAADQGRRKIVLATSIAETSLTIEGVRVVVDSGLSRLPRYEPGLGLTRLETLRVSRASADQRRGRAGRTQPGVCYRMWEQAGLQALEPFTRPEILSCDLTGLALDLAAWGVRDPATLSWLDPPPPAAFSQARSLLIGLGALQADGALTREGRAMRALPLPPRLARMVVASARKGEADLAAEIAVVLTERSLGGEAIDVEDRVSRLRSGRGALAQAARAMARGWVAEAKRSTTQSPSAHREPAARCGPILALAYPDRIAKARGRTGVFLMANGRAAALEPADPLAREDWLAIAEVSGRAVSQRILAATALTQAEAEQAAGAAAQTTETIAFDAAAGALRARRTRRLGAIVIEEQTLAVPHGPHAARVFAEGIAAAGLARLPWTRAQSQWRERVAFLRAMEGDAWPDVSDAALEASVDSWLAPFLEGRDSLASITSEDLERALRALLDWRLARRLDEEAPACFLTPAGSNVPIDYAAEGGPALAVRVQELFGLSRHPRVAAGRAPLTLHLLSPARRPIQITRDLPGFWTGSWAQVKSEMRGRYPKHAWPDDPVRAVATLRAKPQAGR